MLYRYDLLDVMRESNDTGLSNVRMNTTGIKIEYLFKKKLARASRCRNLDKLSYFLLLLCKEQTLLRISEEAKSGT